MAKIVAITNQKGGVGKTTTSINLSAALGLHGKKILLIDIDPQGNSTTGLGVDKNKIVHSIYDVYTSDIKLKDVIVKDVCKNVDVAPALVNLATAEMVEKEQETSNILMKNIKEIFHDYDYVFLDCPPSISTISKSALVVAHTVIIPMQSEYYALEGLAQLLNSIRLIHENYNKALKIEGILITMYSNTNISKAVSKEVKKYFKEKVYKTYIPRAVSLSEAPSYGQSIFDYKMNSKASDSYYQLANEFLKNNNEL